MKSINWKSLLPHGVAVLLFLIIAFIFNSPVLEGKRLVANDDTQFRGAVKEIADFRKNEGSEPLWFNNMFSGMPTYTVSFAAKNNWVEYIYAPMTKTFPVPVSQMFWAMVGFYIMLLTFGFKPYASAIGAIAYGFCSYNMGIIGAGHYAKLAAIAFFPMIVTGINLLFKKKYVWGAILTGFAMAAEILTNHPQMTYYYFMFFLLMYLVYLFVNAVIKKEIKHAVIASALAGVMIIAGIATNANRLLPVNEYTAFSTRGGSDLKSGSKDETGGLKRSYIVGYSNGKDDILSLLVPNFKGPNNGQLVENDIAKKALGKDRNMVGQVEGLIYQDYQEMIDQYWGGADIALPNYSSVIIFALFLLGFAFVKHPVKWIIIPAFLVTMMLSWGKNYMGFTNIFIDHFPLYNKFRAVNSIMIVITFCVPLLASFMLARLVNEPEFLEKPGIGKYKNKHLFAAGLGLILLVLLAMYASPTTFQSFTKPVHYVDKVERYMTEVDVITEALKAQQVPDGEIGKIISNIENARIAIFRADAIRSIGFLLLGAVALGLYAFKKINWKVMIAIVGVLVLADVWMHDSRYINEKNFKEITKAKNDFAPTPADQFILNDKGLHHRVMNMTVSTFNDATTSYYHKSLGGYSGAKMGRYQDVIERGISPELNRLYSTEIFTPNGKNLDSVLATLQVLNMLNTKYFILDKGSRPLTNMYANGPAWIVSNVQWAADANAEIEGLSKFNLKKTAIIGKEFEAMVKNKSLVPDSTATIKITKCISNALEYEFNASTDQVVVFSEIYYPLGWDAYIDGSPAEYFRANYVLRGMFVPKGKHKIEFMFDPTSVKKGATYSLIASIFLFLALAGGIVYEFRKYKKGNGKA